MLSALLQSTTFHFVEAWNRWKRLKMHSDSAHLIKVSYTSVTQQWRQKVSSYVLCQVSTVSASQCLPLCIITGLGFVNNLMGSSWPLVKVKKLVKELFNFLSLEDQCNGKLLLGHQQSQSCTHAEQSNMSSELTGLHLLLPWIGCHQNVSRNCLW